MTETIRIVCTDAARHPVKRPEVTITTFRVLGLSAADDPMSIRWTEDNRSPRLRGTGRTLVGNEVYKSGQGQSGPYRSNHRLICPKHPERGHIDLTEEKLFRALNLSRHAGVNRLSLQDIGAIVERMESIDS